MEIEWMEIISTVALLLAGVVAYYGVGFLRTKGILDKIRQKEVFALLAVKFVEEYYSHLDGPEKLEKACEWLAGRLKSINIKTDADEVKGLVLAMLREIKDEFGEEWAKHSAE